MTRPRMPTIYLPHGGGPWPWMGDHPLFGPEPWTAITAYLRGLPASVPTPAAILCVTAHWEEDVPTVSSAARPGMLYDYYGFPPETYEVVWPAPGDPALAKRVRALLAAAGLPHAEDPDRGYDHGTFVPLAVAWPDADVPVVQLSLVRGLDPATHLAVGRALRPLRDEGVLIVGSGSSYHDLRGFRSRDAARRTSEAFHDWLDAAVVDEASARDAALRAWAAAPSARDAHPREEHLLPLMVAAGAAGDDRGAIALSGPVMGVRMTAVHFG